MNKAFADADRARAKRMQHEGTDLELQSRQALFTRGKHSCIIHCVWHAGNQQHRMEPQAAHCTCLLICQAVHVNVAASMQDACSAHGCHAGGLRRRLSPWVAQSCSCAARQSPAEIRCDLVSTARCSQASGQFQPLPDPKCCLSQGSLQPMLTDELLLRRF